MKNLTTILLLLGFNLFFLSLFSQNSFCQTDEFKVHLKPVNIGVPNLQTPLNYPVAGFGRRQTENVWVPFQFEIPDHTGLVVKEAFLNVIIEAIDANGDMIADADFYTDTVEGCGKNGREDGVGLFGSFPSLYSAGENPLTAKTIKIDLTAFPKILDVLNFEKILHALSEDDHSVLDAWLDIIFGPEGPAKVSIKNVTKTPTPQMAFIEIPAQVAAGNFPAIPMQRGTEILYLVEFEVMLEEKDGDRGDVKVEIVDEMPLGMKFKKFYWASHPTSVSNVTDNTITFNPFVLKLPDEKKSHTFKVQIIYAVELNSSSARIGVFQNNASVIISDVATGNGIITRPIQGAFVSPLWPRLHLDKFTSTYSLNAGKEVSFTIVARNEGNISFPVDIDAVIPDNVTIDQSSIYPTPFTIVGNRIQWRNLNINPFANEGFSYRVTINNNTPNETILTDQGFATAIVDPGINAVGTRRLNAVSNIVSVKVLNEPIIANIGVTLTATPDEGVYPMYITYSIIVTNTGEEELRDVTLTLTQRTLPLAGNPDFPLNIGILQPGENKTIIYKGQIGANQVDEIVDIVIASGIAFRNGSALNIPPLVARANATVTVLYPIVSHVTPSAEQQGSKNLLLKIEGINFSPGYSFGTGLSFDPDVGIEIIPPESPGYGFVDFDELNYHVNIADDAPLGEYEVFVTNPNAYSGKSSEGNGITITGEAKDPEVSTISPVGATRRNQNIVLTITGGNFAIDAKVDFGVSGIIINDSKLISSHKIKVNIDIPDNALMGFIDVSVTNPDGRKGIGEGLFEVIESLGNVELTWNKTIPGLVLAPPSDLNVQLLSSETLTKNIDLNKQIKIKRPIGNNSIVFKKNKPNHSTLIDTMIIIDEIEPNNNFSEAQVVKGDSVIFIDGEADISDAGSIILKSNNGDDDIEDLYKFTITEPGIEIDLWGFSSDCDLYLFNKPDSSGLIDWSHNVVLEGDELIINPELPIGTYYVGVSIYDPNPQGPDISYYGLDLYGIFGEETINEEIDNSLKSYIVYRSLSESASKTGIVIASVDTNTTTLQDKPPTKANYYYQVTADYGFGESVPSNESILVLTSIEHKEVEELPNKFQLSQNYPNPFNPETTINFSLPIESRVNIVVYNILGARIKTIFNNEKKEAGFHSVSFSCINLASGVYFVRMTIGKFIDVKKIMLLK